MALLDLALNIGLFSSAQTPPAASQQPTNPITSPSPEQQIPLVEQFKKTVVFITGKYSRQITVKAADGSSSLQQKELGIEGTGFLVQVPVPELGPKGTAYYLVTNKHMVREPGPDGTTGAGPYLKQLEVRINTKQPVDAQGDSYITLPILVMDDAGDFNCFIDTKDTDVDLAVCPISVDLKTWDIRTIESKLFVSPEIIESEKINESNEIFFAGLFTSFRGVKRNYPIVRHGKLAMLSGERVPILRADKTAEVYLADVMSFGGNSGSPVLVKSGGMTDSGIGPTQYLLLGIMQGYFNTNSPVAVQTGWLPGVAAENTGVAFIVPAQKISEILTLPETKYCQDAWRAQFLAQSGKTSEAQDLLFELHSRSLPLKTAKGCQFLIYSGLNSIAKAQGKPANDTELSEATKALSSLWWRTNIKSSVNIEFTTALMPFGLKGNFFLVGEDQDAEYILPPDDEDAQGSPIRVPKVQISKITHIQ